MTETVANINLADVREFRASALTIARSLRDYMSQHLVTDATTIVDAINAKLVASEQITISAAYQQASSYLDFSQVLPKNPPFVHVLVPRWRRYEGHRKVRQYDAFVVVVAAWDVPEKVALVHGVVEEALALMFSEPLKERLMVSDQITDVAVEELLTQEASASELGYMLGGGEGEPDSTLLRETQINLTVLKREPYN